MNVMIWGDYFYVEGLPRLAKKNGTVTGDV